MTKKKMFSELSRDEQAEIVRNLMERGGSYGLIAKKYGVKRGRIAGICRDYHIPSKHEPNFERANRLREERLVQENRQQRSQPRPPLAAHETVQCVAHSNGNRCGYRKAPGSEYCEYLHFAKK